MSKQNFYAVLAQELERIEDAKTAKRFEKIITGFSSDHSPRAIIANKSYLVFNSNDYLGLRHDARLKTAEHEASQKYGTGPGAVRFISGSLQVHKDLEAAVAKFHGRDDAMIFSSAFATNLAVLFCLIKGQAADTKVGGDTLVISDELNHRSIIDGIRVANLPKENRAVFKHMDASDLERILQENAGKFKRVLVVTDGVFSMLGEYQDLKKIKDVITHFDDKYEQGVLLVVDDAHGIGAFGQTGRGTEEVTGAKADVLIGTFGKAFGADGGYVVGDQVVIDYLRESAATYIYSNSISPGTAGAALAALEIMQGEVGKSLLTQSRDNLAFFQNAIKDAGLQFACESNHPIQPILMGEAARAVAFKTAMLDVGVLVTSINYPVVAKGKDEIRVQLSSAHTQEDINYFVTQAAKWSANV